MTKRENPRRREREFNKFKEKNMAVEINLDFFVEENGLYERFSEQFSERAYSCEQIEKALQKAGLQVVAVFDDMTEQPLSDTTERAIYVTRKVK